MLETAIEALGILMTPERLVFMFLGVCVGITLGILPGLGGLVGMSVMMPFIFSMDPFTGTAMLIGLMVVGSTSDTFPSVLLGIPGSAGSQATIVDGYPLARRGEAARALGASFSASLIGGIVGALVLLLGVVALRPLVLLVGSPELLMMAVFGVAMVAVLARGALLPGLIAAAVGLLLGAVGGAPGALEYRYTFGQLYLYDGISIVLVALGFFAIPEIVALLAANRPVSEGPLVKGGLLKGMRETLSHKMLVLRSSIVGTIIGIIPGLGGAVVDWIAYGLAKQTSKNSETFGTGDIRGVIAPESANNAKEGGSMVPTLMFGIPGSSTAALLLGGLLVMGVQPGPAMVNENLDLTLSIVWGVAIANVLAVILCLVLTPQMARMTRIPPTVLAPFLLVLVVMGAYQSGNHWGDLVVLTVLGTIGIAFKELGWPRSPVIIGFVLALAIERNLHISLTRYGLDTFLRPAVIIMGLVIFAVIWFSLRHKPASVDVDSSDREGAEFNEQPGDRP